MTRWMALATALSVMGLAVMGSATPAMAADGTTPNRQLVGEFALGASFSTGNTKRKAVDVDGKAKYRAGRVEDKYKVAAEYARERGVNTARRYLAGYQSNVDIQDGLFGLGFLQYEDDKFSGFQSEIEAGFGVGYRVLQTSDMLLSVEAGPGYRISKLKAPLADEKKIFARGTAIFEYKLSDTAKITDELTISWDSVRTKVENTLAVTSTLIGNLAGRASFNFRHNSDPPGVTIKKTDTITKLALVYGF